MLVQCGNSKSHVISAQIWLKDATDYYAMNAEWDPWVDQDSAPVQGYVQSPMAQPRYLMEVLLIAAKD